MAEVFDILTGENGLVIKNGDIAIGESTLQHQTDLLLTHKGELKHTPDAGVGLAQFLLDEGESEDKVTAAITEEFERDGMVVNSIDSEVIDAEYRG